jgi:hypothetical protein
VLSYDNIMDCYPIIVVRLISYHANDSGLSLYAHHQLINSSKSQTLHGGGEVPIRPNELERLLQVKWQAPSFSQGSFSIISVVGGNGKQREGKSWFSITFQCILRQSLSKIENPKLNLVTF